MKYANLIFMGTTTESPLAHDRQSSARKTSGGPQFRNLSARMQ